PFQSSAPSAFLPALKSGSSCAQSASDATDVVVVQIGQSSGKVALSAPRPSPLNSGVILFRQPGGLIVYMTTLATSAPSTVADTIARLIGVFSDLTAAGVWPDRQRVIFVHHLWYRLGASMPWPHGFPAAPYQRSWPGPPACRNTLMPSGGRLRCRQRGRLPTTRGSGWESA